jgi:hypothetical protein
VIPADPPKRQVPVPQRPRGRAARLAHERLRHRRRAAAHAGAAGAAGVQGIGRLESGTAVRSSCGAAPGGKSSAIRSSNARRRRSTCPTTRCAAPGAVPPGARAVGHQTGRRGYPQITTTPQITTGHAIGQSRQRDGARAGFGFLLPVDVSYEADVWGRVRLGVASAVATRRRAPRISRRCGCRCTPSWRSITSSCAGSTPSA